MRLNSTCDGNAEGEVYFIQSVTFSQQADSFVDDGVGGPGRTFRNPLPESGGFIGGNSAFDRKVQVCFSSFVQNDAVRCKGTSLSPCSEQPYICTTAITQCDFLFRGEMYLALMRMTSPGVVSV